jgi:hypothetical protein
MIFMGGVRLRSPHPAMYLGSDRGKGGNNDDFNNLHVVGIGVVLHTFGIEAAHGFGGLLDG